MLKLFQKYLLYVINLADVFHDIKQTEWLSCYIEKNEHFGKNLDKLIACIILE